MKILMITSEAVPFAKTGGLADMVSALSLELKRQGHDVRIILPRYYSIDKAKMTQHKKPLGTAMKNNEEWCAVYESTLPESDVPVYFIDHDGFFGRNGIYGPTPDEAFQDNGERFGYFSQASFQLCRYLNWIPDILHCHDWVSGTVPLILKTSEAFTEFSHTSSILTIHNLGYQGIFNPEICQYLNLEIEDFKNNGGIKGNTINYLKTGIENCQIVTTVSPTYAREIRTAEYGCGLEEALNYRKSDLFGILNGIDYSIWNPETDKYIKPYNFTRKHQGNKRKAKKRLQQKAGFDVDSKVPIVAMITRLADQKGTGPLCGPSYGSLFSICWDMDLQFVILGTGEKWCEDELLKLNSSLENLRVWIRYNNEMSHLIEAGADFFLMPSKYEPCGLNQLYSLSYGTLPIVRNTGGLADTVENYNPVERTGTGFVFNDYTPEAIYGTVKWAVDTWYSSPKEIKRMRTNAMGRRFSWEVSAARYAEIYQWSQDRIG